jgi:hypothetical protein
MDKLNNQIFEALVMLENTKKLIENNKNDKTLEFMLKQDEKLLFNLKKERIKILCVKFYKNKR